MFGNAALFDQSDEDGSHQGLGLVGGTIQKLEAIRFHLKDFQWAGIVPIFKNSLVVIFIKEAFLSTHTKYNQLIHRIYLHIQQRNKNIVITVVKRKCSVFSFI